MIILLVTIRVVYYVVKNTKNILAKVNEVYETTNFIASNVVEIKQDILNFNSAAIQRSNDILLELSTLQESISQIPQLLTEQDDKKSVDKLNTKVRSIKDIHKLLNNYNNAEILKQQSE
jgi:hypothetical protein